MTANGLKPINEHQSAIESLIYLLCYRRDDPPPSLEDILPLVTVDPAYTSRLIAVNRLTLLSSKSVESDKISRLVRELEWRFGRRDRLIKSYLLDRSDRSFLIGKIQTDPASFTPADLRVILSDSNDDTLRDFAHKALLNNVLNFASRLTLPPLRMSEDVESLAKQIKDYGFDPHLNAILHRVDQALQSDKDAFEQINVMREIRAFFERFHRSVAEELQRRVPSTKNNTPLEKCGQAIEYLKLQDVTSEKIRELGKTLWGILSDDEFGVHAIKATRDYTRLCRNMVIEYAIVLLLELERRVASERTVNGE